MSELELRPSDATNLAGEDTGRAHLSHSQLTTHLACNRKWELSYKDRLELIQRPMALTLGRAFQKSIEENDPRSGSKQLRDERRVNTQEDEDQLRKDETLIEASARLYLRKWPAPESEQREYEYRVQLRSPWTGYYSRTFDLMGYADGIEEVGEFVELTENKLVGQVNELAVKRLLLDRQVALECYGIWRAKGKRVTKVRYRWIRKAGIKQRGGRKDDKSDAESVDQFCARLAQDYIERPDFYAIEEETFRTDEDMLRVEAELWRWAEDMRRSNRENFHPRNTSHCHDYGGCAFIPICAGDDDARALYRVRPERKDDER